MTKIAVVIQARMSSQRLPKKVLMPLAGAPSLVRMIERVRRTKADHIVVACSSDASDDPIARVCAQHDADCHRGSLNDVLERVEEAAPQGCDVVRLTADCPLIDPKLVDHHIDRFKEEQPWAEYVTNAWIRTHPDGLDVEVVRRDVLRAARNLSSTAYDREHVTPWVRRHARTVPITQETDLSALRITLDDADDYKCISGIYDALYPSNPEFGTSDIYALLVERPNLIRLASDEPVGDFVGRMAAHLRSMS